MKKRNTITVLDIGTSKVCAAVVMPTEGSFELCAFSQKEVPPNAIIKGEIIDLSIVYDELVFEVLAAVEKDSGADIESTPCYLSVTGNHIKNQFGRGYSAVINDRRIVTEVNIIEAMESARYIPLPVDQSIINSVDAYFVLDGKSRAPHPLGHPAHQIEAFSHIIFGDSNKINAVCNAVFDVGFECETTAVFSGIASACSSLTEDEQQRGVLMIDMGAGTTEYILVCESGVTASGVITVGTQHIVNDLAIGLDLHADTAKEILESQMIPPLIKSGETVLDLSKLVPNSKRSIPLASYSTICDLRIRELFRTVKNRIAAQGLIPTIDAGIVLTGGGALFPDVRRIASEQFSAPVRIGYPTSLVHDSAMYSPQYATLCGLILFALQDAGARDISPELLSGQWLYNIIISFPAWLRNQWIEIYKSMRW